jgi:hypothetical protein
VSGVDDLVEWLSAQLDEDERIARAAAHLSGGVSAGVPAVGERWRVSGSHTDGGGTYWSVTTASPDLDRVPVVEMVGSGMSGGGAHTEEVAVHIVEHDPARVLREIDAKRHIVDAYLPPGGDPHPGLPCTDDIEGDPDGIFYAEQHPAEKGACVRHLEASKRLLHHDYVLRLLALPYADRPGYLESWRP